MSDWQGCFILKNVSGFEEKVMRLIYSVQFNEIHPVYPKQRNKSNEDILTFILSIILNSSWVYTLFINQPPYTPIITQHRNNNRPRL